MLNAAAERAACDFLNPSKPKRNHTSNSDEIMKQPHNLSSEKGFSPPRT
jgi:hypothetical protein